MAGHLIRAVALVLLSAACVWADGGAIFKQQCAKCHGDSGKSDTAVGKKMNIPPIAGDGEIAAMSDEDLTKKILASEKHPKGVKNLPAADAGAVATFVKQLAVAK